MADDEVMVSIVSSLQIIFSDAHKTLNLQPGSPRSISTYNAWLQTCCKDHLQCMRPSDIFRPTRCLEIFKEQGAISIRLNRTPDNSPYAVLSYCWGGDQNVKLVKKNIGRLSAGIDFSDLPATLKDAIKLTSDLHITFL